MLIVVSKNLKLHSIILRLGKNTFDMEYICEYFIIKLQIFMESSLQKNVIAAEEPDVKSRRILL